MIPWRHRGATGKGHKNLMAVIPSSGVLRRAHIHLYSMCKLHIAGKKGASYEHSLTHMHPMQQMHHLHRSCPLATSTRHVGGTVSWSRRPRIKKTEKKEERRRSKEEHETQGTRRGEQGKWPKKATATSKSQDNAVTIKVSVCRLWLGPGDKSKKAHKQVQGSTT